MANEPNLEKLRQIILEPDMSALANRMAKAETKLAEIDPKEIEAVRKELAAAKAEMEAVKKELEEVKSVIVGFNRKLTRAFSGFTSFVKPGEGE